MHLLFDSIDSDFAQQMTQDLGLVSLMAHIHCKFQFKSKKDC
jgi:hypothetical protein